MARKPEAHEGEDFSTDAFCEMFSTNQNTEKRLKAERHANRTIKKNARRPIRTEQVNFRTTREDKELAALLAKHLGISMGKMYDMAVRDLAKRKGLKVKK